MKQIAFGLQDWLYLGRSFWKLVLALLGLDVLVFAVFVTTDPSELAMKAVICVATYSIVGFFYDVGLIFTYGIATLFLCTRHILIQNRGYDPAFELFSLASLMFLGILVVYGVTKFSRENKIHRSQTASAILGMFAALAGAMRFWSGM